MNSFWISLINKFSSNKKNKSIIVLNYYSFEVSIRSVAKFFERRVLFEKCGEKTEEILGVLG